MRFVARCGVMGARSLGRSLGAWPALVLLFWTLLLKLQEPGFFRRQEVPFYWESLTVMSMVVVGALPLAWRLSQGPDAALWTLRSSLLRHTVENIEPAA